MYQEDYILRMVLQLGAAIARIAGLNQRDEHRDALAEADRAWGEVLGDIPPEMAASVDSHTLAGMLRQPARIRLASQILGEQARALAGQGDDAGCPPRPPRPGAAARGARRGGRCTRPTDAEPARRAER
jgi:hypothetical protein